MQRIINFILRNRSSLLFLFLLAFSLLLTVQNNALHRARFFNSSNWLSGTVYSASNSVTGYFGLRRENEKLLQENRRLRSLLFNSRKQDSMELDTSRLDYRVMTATIIKNSYTDANNYITIDKGRADSVNQDMGVITSRGILGIVEMTSKNYASVQSILNTKSNINAKIAGTDYFGSLTWNRKNHQLVQLEDIPRLVPLREGDTIVTGAMSSIFPENIPIGTIEGFSLTESQSFYQIDVRLFNDMTNLKQVYLIRNRDRDEILQLESDVANDL
ncbi:rod shape-determining protein MreC [Robiginitalea sp. SC105]|uniref:rod shape-determining protein MreC n=1 Tax=Robiginitalea sp. SC105 TaxID=2762332 RepID=UPI00163A35C6|nr:rod shape-determining protein MreC [Robiginitalea sp. SC105]MBC2837786.1 rod shape-determining protein MreC [Robiginitalea sp. SC105]